MAANGADLVSRRERPTSSPTEMTHSDEDLDELLMRAVRSLTPPGASKTPSQERAEDLMRDALRAARDRAAGEEKMRASRAEQQAAADEEAREAVDRIQAGAEPGGIDDTTQLLRRAHSADSLAGASAESIDSASLLGLASVGYEAIQDGVAKGDPALLSHLSESFGAARSQLVFRLSEASGTRTTPHDAMMDLIDDHRTARPSLRRVAAVAALTSVLTVLATNWLAGASGSTTSMGDDLGVRATLEELEQRQAEDRSILVDLNDRVQMLADRILSEQERPIIGEE